MFDGAAKANLISFIERIERIKSEEKALKEDIKEILASAKNGGFEPKLIKKVVSLREQDQEKRRLEEAELELYKHAVGLE